MKDWLLARPIESKVILGLGLLIVFLFVLLVVKPLVVWNLHSLHRIEQAQPRIGRLLGFEGSSDALESSLRSSRDAVNSLLHRRRAGEASVGSAAQQQLRLLAEGVGFSVLGSQLMDPIEENGLVDTRIAVDLKGDVESLQALLEMLSLERPFLLARELKLSPAPVRRGQAEAQEVIVKLVVSAFSQSAGSFSSER
jgi:hypothetical protein